MYYNVLFSACQYNMLYVFYCYISFVYYYVLIPLFDIVEVVV